MKLKENIPSNCPDCNGEREWAIEGVLAVCLFCGLTGVVKEVEDDAF
jgi:hypothetical protein